MSKCGSKWGYARCIHSVHHEGACEGSGFRWMRGRGHSRPFLLRDPSTPPALGENGPPVFGVDRLPEKERTCPAWPTLASVEGRREAAYTRFIAPARRDPRYVEMVERFTTSHGYAPQGFGEARIGQGASHT